MSNNSYWLGWLPLTQYKQGRESFSVPAFSFSSMTWLGASYIVAKFTFSGSRSFSLDKLNAPAGVTYCPVINTGSVRYKLWEDVDELLDVPLYNNEVIPTGSLLEIWTVSSSTAPASTGLTLATSRLADRTSVTSSDSSSALTATTSIWAAMPLVLPATFSSAKA